MNKNEKRHRVTISVSNNELEALEDSLVAWNLCKKHNAQAWSPKTGEKTEQEIFKMQDECESCKRYNNKPHRKAWQIASRLFRAWDANH